MSLFVFLLTCLFACMYVDMLIMHVHHRFIALYVVHFVLPVLWDYEIMWGRPNANVNAGDGQLYF